MRILSSACLLALALVPCLPRGSPGSSLGNDTNWLASPFYPVGTDHEVMSCLVYEGDLVISGNFATVGDVVAPGVARWDGTQWHAYPAPEPAGSGIPDAAVGGVLTEYEGKLTVVQAFPTIPQGFYTIVRVLSWNGTDWDEGPYITQFIGFQLQDVPDRKASSAVTWNGNLLVTPATPAGDFFEIPGQTGAVRIAQWDGNEWSAFADAEESVTYRQLEAWSGNLFASGLEYGVGWFVDRWDGTAWAGSSPYQATDFSAHAGDLYAATMSQVLRWDGASWTQYGSPITVEVIGSSPAGLVAATGQDAQRWDGLSWNPLGDLEGVVNQLGEYEGSLVAVGTGVTPEYPQTGIPAPYLTGIVSLYDGTSWDVPGPQTGRALKGNVEALRSYQGRLYAAGDFALPGSNQAAVAAWDGTDWELVRENPNERTRAAALTEYDGDLVVAEATPLQWLLDREITAFNGSTWNVLGTVKSSAMSLAVFDGNLVAGGTFTSVSGVPAGRIASWNGIAWSEVGGGVDGPLLVGDPVRVAALQVWDNRLIVGGKFETAGTKDIHYIASWNGNQWHDLEPTGSPPLVVTGPVKALAAYNGDLVASGSFWGTDVIASWDGQDWSPLGGGLNAAPQALYTHDGYLFASGETLIEAEGMPVNHIAVWDGTAWHAMGSGLELPRPMAESPGWTFAEYQGHLYVGGNFRTAGGKASNYLAIWETPTTTAVPEPSVGQVLAVRPGFPNPCRTTTCIPFSLPNRGRVTAEVFDLAGRRLGTILDRDLSAGEHEVSWTPRDFESDSGNSLAAGTYFLRIRALGQSRTQKIVYLP